MFKIIEIYLIFLFHNQICHPEISDDNGYLVPGQYLDVMHPHFARNVGENAMPCFQLYSKHRVRQGLDDLPLYLDRVIFRHGSFPECDREVDSEVCSDSVSLSPGRIY